MKLNTIAPADGSKFAPKRLGRGIGSGLGKTCGKGHKGQKARAGGYHKINFEGGQMPIQRRLPKMGFKSRVAKFVKEVTLSEISLIQDDVVDLIALKKAGVIQHAIKSVKVILSGEVLRPLKIQGLKVTAGAKTAIEAKGGAILA